MNTKNMNKMESKIQLRIYHENLEIDGNRRLHLEMKKRHQRRVGDDTLGKFFDFGHVEIHDGLSRSGDRCHGLVRIVDRRRRRGRSES
jgi:hypothetical protein